MTYPASLRQQAAWIREALDPATPDTQRITLGDVDVEELEAAADRIEQLEERMRGAEALIALWETRATRAEARVEALEKHKHLQMEDVMSLGAQLGQAWQRIEALTAEVEKWHRVAMEAGAITCSDGRHVYPRIERLEAENADLRRWMSRANSHHAASHARIEELEAVLREILDGHPDAFDLARKAIAPEQKK